MRPGFGSSFHYKEVLGEQRPITNLFLTTPFSIHLARANGHISVLPRFDFLTMHGSLSIVLCSQAPAFQLTIFCLCFVLIVVSLLRLFLTLYVCICLRLIKNTLTYLPGFEPFLCSRYIILKVQFQLQRFVLGCRFSG